MRKVPEDIVEFSRKLSTTGFTTREKTRYLLIACATAHGKILSTGNLMSLLANERTIPSATTVASEISVFNTILAKKLKKTKFIYSIEQNALRLYQEIDGA